MTEKGKMLSGLLYDPSAEDLPALRERAHTLSLRYNQLPDSAQEDRTAILRELLPQCKEGVFLQGPIQFDYGCFTSIGEGCYANFNFTVLDCAPVKIGKSVFFGPNVSIYTPVHPMCWQEREPYRKPDGTLTDREYARPVEIGDHCWIAGSVVICGGVHIGEGSVIGAGSVVTRSIPAHVFAAGNPCRVIRPITAKDQMLETEK